MFFAAVHESAFGTSRHSLRRNSFGRYRTKSGHRVALEPDASVAIDPKRTSSGRPAITATSPNDDMT
jgi:hypothetical protein